MDYLKFKNQFNHLPVIHSHDVLAVPLKRQALLNQINRWQARKLIVQLKRGMYLLNPQDRKIHPDPVFLANQLYCPYFKNS